MPPILSESKWLLQTGGPQATIHQHRSVAAAVSLHIQSHTLRQSGHPRAQVRTNSTENSTEIRTMNSTWMRLPLATIVILTAGFFSAIQAQTRSAGLLNFSSDGSRVACSNRDSGTVTILSWPELKVQHEIAVGSHPEGVAWIGTTHRLACCVYGDDEIAVLDTDCGQGRSLALRSQPVAPGRVQPGDRWSRHREA